MSRLRFRNARFGFLIVVLAGSLCPLVLAQQNPPGGNGFISGQVVEGGSKRPVPGATVTLSLITPRGPARQ